MDVRLSIEQSPHRVAGVWAITPPQSFHERLWIPARRAVVERPAIIKHQASMAYGTEAVGLLQYCIEDGCYLTRRAVDNLQYLGGCGLLLQGLARLGDQPCVLNRDHRLCREIFDERDFFFGKRPHFLAGGDDLPEQDVILAQRHVKDCTDPAEF